MLYVRTKQCKHSVKCVCAICVSCFFNRANTMIINLDSYIENFSKCFLSLWDFIRFILFYYILIFSFIVQFMNKLFGYIHLLKVTSKRLNMRIAMFLGVKASFVITFCIYWIISFIDEHSSTMWTSTQPNYYAKNYFNKTQFSQH